MTDTQTIQSTINYLDGLYSELARNAEADTTHVPVFRYSDELVEYMNAHEVTDPNEALGLISDTLDELTDERDADDPNWPGSWREILGRWNQF